MRVPGRYDIRDPQRRARQRARNSADRTRGRGEVRLAPFVGSHPEPQSPES